MKKIALLTAAAFLFSVAAMAQVKPDEVIKVNTEKYDFGKIKQSVPVTYSFEITNISKKPVVVENSRASCGCTTPEKIVDPIAPGQTTKLKVQYNAGALGVFNKEVFVKIAGVDDEKKLFIGGEVLDAAAYDQWIKSKGKGK
ncbi:MAG TPA: DUF1573 domain-containing protein [Chitinophagaceae bacterium]|jgi:hypothetical protein|nr:DUF1573 domain-containing protein [Chitinophagaceae bacterium]